jgi:hypothetical protein
MTNAIQEHLHTRSRTLNDIREILKDTMEHYKSYASHSKAEMDEMQALFSALQGDVRLKIVVTGEYSTGKSTLINALLGIKLLPMDLRATTCINAFLRGVKEGEAPYIQVEFVDGREERLPYSAQEIERWGSELDKENKELRKDIKKIVVFSDHDLLKAELEIIDTPGFQSLEPQHERIALQAISEAHVALWLQGAQQMGGRESEWKFLEEKLSKVFERIVPAINAWDIVWENTDNDKPLKEREEEYLNIFTQSVAKRNLSPEIKKALSNPENLFRISARWSLLGTPAQKQKAAPEMERLAQKIKAICQSVDAQREILSKPLRQLLLWQDALLSDLQNALRSYKDSSDLKTLAQEEKDIHLQIASLQHQMEQARHKTEVEHSYQRKEMLRRLEEDFIQPLKDLRGRAEDQITLAYVKKELEKSAAEIGVPFALKEQQRRLLAELEEKWRVYQQELTFVFRDLSASYEKQMGGSFEQLRKSLETKKLSLPPLQAKIQIDFSQVQAFHKKKQEIEEEQRRLEEEQQRIGLEIEKGKKEEEHLREERLRQERLRASLEREREVLGAPPPPRIYYEQVYDKENDGYLAMGWRWLVGGKPPMRQIERKDNSQREEWKREAENIERRKENKEQEIQELIVREKERTGLLLDRAAAGRKVEALLQKQERELKRLEEKARGSLDEQAEEILRRLKDETVDTIARMLNIFSDDLKQLVQQCFEQNQTTLQEFVKRGLLEPLQRQELRLQEIQQKRRQGEEKIKEEIDRLQKGEKKLLEMNQYTKELQKNLKAT